jgi:hypothetical protein
MSGWLIAMRWDVWYRFQIARKPRIREPEIPRFLAAYPLGQAPVLGIVAGLSPCLFYTLTWLF